MSGPAPSLRALRPSGFALSPFHLKRHTSGMCLSCLQGAVGRSCSRQLLP